LEEKKTCAFSVQESNEKAEAKSLEKDVSKSFEKRKLISVLTFLDAYVLALVVPVRSCQFDLEF
jgi:hypothetical protein